MVPYIPRKDLFNLNDRIAHAFEVDATARRLKLVSVYGPAKVYVLPLIPQDGLLFTTGLARQGCSPKSGWFLVNIGERNAAGEGRKPHAENVMLHEFTHLFGHAEHYDGYPINVMNPNSGAFSNLFPLPVLEISKTKVRQCTGLYSAFRTRSHSLCSLPSIP
jgi:hypothetical protein